MTVMGFNVTFQDKIAQLGPLRLTGCYGHGQWTMDIVFVIGSIA